MRTIVHVDRFSLCFGCLKNTLWVHPIFLVGGRRRDKPSIEEVGPTGVFEAASDGGQGVGVRFRPTVPGLFESDPDDALASIFHNAGSGRQAAFR